MRLYIVDAFTDRPFGGNGAGVVIGGNLTENNMQKLAAELRFSETAFVEQINDNIFKVRFFTPVSEVDLCGHASIAAFKCLLNEGIVNDNSTHKMECNAGLLEVTIKNNMIFLEQSKPIIGDNLNNYEYINSIAKILRLHPEDIGDKNHNLFPQIVSTGLFDIILPLKNYDALNRVNPNFDALSSFSKQLNVVGIHAFTLDSKNCTARCRNFAPLYGINEEAATGTASGALLYYLYINRVLARTNNDIEFIQGENMGRPSKIICKIINDDGLKLFVGGYSSIISSGELFL